MRHQNVGMSGIVGKARFRQFRQTYLANFCIAHQLSEFRTGSFGTSVAPDWRALRGLATYRSLGAQKEYETNAKVRGK